MVYLFFAFLTLSTFLLYRLNYSFRFFSHFLLSLLVHGVSGGKIYFLLLYASGLFLLLFFRSIRGGSVPKEAGWTKKAFLFSLGVGMAASLGSYLHYLQTFSLPMGAYHYHFREIDNSVNFFPHIHTSKVFLFRSAELLGLEGTFGGMDDGRAFVQAVPKAYGFLTLASVLSALFLSFHLAPGIVLRWKREYRTGMAILNTLAFHSVIKSLSDGGPLAYDFLVAIAALLILFHAQGPDEVRLFLKKRWKVFFWAGLGIFALKGLIDPSLGLATYTLKHGTVHLALYLFIYLLTLKGSSAGSRAKGVLILGLTLFLFYIVYTRHAIYLRPFLMDLEEGTTIHYFHYKDRSVPERLRGSQIVFDSDFLRIYRLTLEKKEQVLDLYRSLGENPYRNRRVAVLRPKPREAYGILAEITFLEFQRRETRLEVPKIVDLKLKEADLGRNRFQGTIAFDPSYFPALAHAEGGRIDQLDENHKFLMYYFLNRFFYHSGVTEFIFTPVGFYRFD
ncbi:MAG: hypothetical protein N3G78_09080 [Desulfobacterota bacterium]|nr:hypothetical protein [Thermodesulfobacteriota bacterium]